MSEAAKTYSGLPAQARRSWMVPVWLKVAFVAFAGLTVATAVGAKAVQHFGRAAERAQAALEADDLGPQPAPAFALPALSGAPVDLSRLRGKVVLVNFWASWCAPCRQEMPSLDVLARRMNRDTFELVAISEDDGWQPVKEFLGLFPGGPPPYSVVLDSGQHVAQTYGTDRFPETYVVDANGVLRYKFVGAREWDRPEVVALLEGIGARSAE